MYGHHRTPTLCTKAHLTQDSGPVTFPQKTRNTFGPNRTLHYPLLVRPSAATGAILAQLRTRAHSQGPHHPRTRACWSGGASAGSVSARGPVVLHPDQAWERDGHREGVLSQRRQCMQKWGLLSLRWGPEPRLAQSQTVNCGHHGKLGDWGKMQISARTNHIRIMRPP